MARYSGFDYNRYVRWYQKQENIANKAGYQMMEPMLNPQQAQARYNATKKILQEEVKSGKMKSVGNIYQYMARDQTSPNSYAQAKAYKEYARITGQKVNINDLRFTEDLDQVLDMSFIRDYIRQQRAAGVAWAQIDADVSRRFFGSP